MAPTRNQGCDRTRREAGDPEGVRGKADVIRSCEGESGAAQRRQAVPERRLGPGPAQPEARCESGRAVAEAFVTRRRPQAATDRTGGRAATCRESVRRHPRIRARRRWTRRTAAGGHAPPDPLCPPVTPMNTAWRKGKFGLGRDMKRHSCTQRISEQVERLIAEGRTDRFGHEVSGRRAGPLARSQNRRDQEGPARPLCAIRPCALRSGPRAFRSA